ncbi:MAG: hypothetical protein PHD21_05640 [Flavobacteriales bacterium]|nr:hypothetical protein [Flavobacteriales bacterium]
MQKIILLFFLMLPLFAIGQSNDKETEKYEKELLKGFSVIYDPFIKEKKYFLDNCPFYIVANEKSIKIYWAFKVTRQGMFPTIKKIQVLCKDIITDIPFSDDELIKDISVRWERVLRSESGFEKFFEYQDNTYYVERVDIPLDGLEGLFKDIMDSGKCVVKYQTEVGKLFYNFSEKDISNTIRVVDLCNYLIKKGDEK